MRAQRSPASQEGVQGGGGGLTGVWASVGGMAQRTSSWLGGWGGGLGSWVWPHILDLLSWLKQTSPSGSVSLSQTQGVGEDGELFEVSGKSL